MFEQTFVVADANDKKRYTVVVSLLLQVTTLAMAIVLPLIYTQVLPQAHLRSVFAAPTPPPPALPKAPPTLARPAVSPRPFLQIIPTNSYYAPLARHPGMTSAPPPDLVIGAPVGTDSTLIGAPAEVQIKPPDPPRAPIARQPVNKPLHMASDIEASQLIRKVQPAYPVIAKETRVQGVVEFTAVISKTGTIENLQLIRGHPLLVTAARDAILQWRYKPTLLNGEPVEVITNIVVNFTLNQ